MTRRFAIAALLAASACTPSRGSDDAGSASPAEASAGAAPIVAAALDSGAPPDPIVGEWERQTEPYKNMRMRVAIRPDMRAVVTASPPVTQERIAQSRSTPAAIAKVQLECQRSLWKPGEDLLTNGRAVGDGVFEATILVRDWGFTGTCRHADSHAPARLTIAADRTLSIEVTRNKTTVTQRWTRVPTDGTRPGGAPR
jgi:hypothetical protein